MYLNGGIMTKSISTALLFFVLTVPGWAQSNGDREKIVPDTPILGPHVAGGQARATPIRAPNLGCKAGPRPPSAWRASIRWGASWTDLAFVGAKISCRLLWYQGVGRSDYAKTCRESLDSSGPVTKS